MGEFYMPAACYDDVAKIRGREYAQALWEKNGGSGPFVNGMIAKPSFQDNHGCVTHGHTEPKRS